jgi:hypothetical protein
VVDSSGFLVLGIRDPGSGIAGFRIPDSGFGSGVSCFVDPGFVFRVLCFGFRVQDSGWEALARWTRGRSIWVLGFGYSGSGIRDWVVGFGFRDSGFGSGVQGLIS